MKTDKKIKGLLLVLIGLVGILVVRDRVSWVKSDWEAYQEQVADWNWEEVRRVKLATAAGELVMTKEDDLWVADEQTLDESKVEQLISSLVEPESVQLVSMKREKWEELGVASGAGTQVEMNKGEEEITWTIGETERGGRYVRIGDEEATYLVGGVPYFATEMNREEWAKEEEGEDAGTNVAEQGNDEMMEERE